MKECSGLPVLVTSKNRELLAEMGCAWSTLELWPPVFPIAGWGARGVRQDR